MTEANTDYASVYNVESYPISLDQEIDIDNVKTEYNQQMEKSPALHVRVLGFYNIVPLIQLHVFV